MQKILQANTENSGVNTSPVGLQILLPAPPAEPNIVHRQVVRATAAAGDSFLKTLTPPPEPNAVQAMRIVRSFLDVLLCDILMSVKIIARSSISLQMIWNTKEWAKKSERGRNNRMKVDSSGAISRHTGGSVGCDEHRILLESYSFYLVEKYGEDETQHPIGDIDLWERSQGEKKQSFGIGSSDRHFILTGTPSSSMGSTPSNVMFEQSQQKEEDPSASSPSPSPLLTA
ncbi:hypothetical protein E3N88_19419 [Mikania micrantha]|uniref:Uncharacterized protein n=1 Tax=Mikania micrantha TaxID=192012 RepID=A0A5N6NQ35_9ASTR|nr:hypothetical protein E3N88_19419 [Mikania micrantha]